MVLKDIVKTFKGEPVLDGVSLTVEDGETLVLFGAVRRRQDSACCG